MCEDEFSVFEDGIHHEIFFLLARREINSKE